MNTVEHANSSHKGPIWPQSGSNSTHCCCDVTEPQDGRSLLHSDPLHHNVFNIFAFCCEQVNQWCESGIYLLASQAVDKCQSQDGAESALADIERFLETAEENQLTELKNLHNQYEVVLSEDIKV